MKLIIGLGNHGEEYKHTRHNVGFMVVEKLAQENCLRFKSNRFLKSLTAEGLIGVDNCYLVKPQTFMNLSGHSVRLLIDWLKIDLDEILLVMDDLSLPFGDLRIRAKGSDGGHKGLRSIIDCLGTNGFARMRVGIRGRKNIKDSSRYVLGGFTKKEEKALPDILDRASQACKCWMEEGVGLAMNRYN